MDTGVSGRIGTKAVDKGVRGERRKSKCETRKSESEDRNSRRWKLTVESVRMQKGKELVGGVGAGGVARGDFTGHDSAGYLSCIVPILELVLTTWEQAGPLAACGLSVT